MQQPHTCCKCPHGTISRAQLMFAGELETGAHNGAVRLHIECPEGTKFVIPVGWTTTMTGEDGQVRQVVTNRYVNVRPVGEDNYQPCCGTISGQGPPDNQGHAKGCHKAEIENKRARIAARVQAMPEIVAPPLFVKLARKTYLNTVKKSVIPQIHNYMLAITNDNGEIKMRPAIPTECKAWSSLAGHKRKTTGQCQPGRVCARNCKLIPCVAVNWGMSEELEAREAYMAQVQQEGGQ